MRITIELRRPARRSVTILLALLLLAAPAVVVASHQFSDVPDSHPFHDDISAIGGAGITSGYSDGTYRPNDAVTRQAMAAFLRRTGGRAALAIGDPPMTSSLSVEAGRVWSSHVPVRQVTITVPGANNSANPNQLVHLQGRVQFFASMSSSTQGCPCAFAAHIRDLATGNESSAQYQTFESDDIHTWAYSVDVEALFAAPPGPRTYELRVALYTRLNDTNAASFLLWSTSSLSATTFPFGPEGTSQMSSGGALNVANDQLLKEPERRRGDE